MHVRKLAWYRMYLGGYLVVEAAEIDVAEDMVVDEAEVAVAVEVEVEVVVEAEYGLV